MTTESLEELRERLLLQERVQQMIQVRAYEIYQMRGGKPGGEAEDWFYAEGEVIAFLLANESAGEENAEVAAAMSAQDGATEPSAPKKPRRAGPKPAAVKGAATKKTSPKKAPARKSAESRSKSKKTSKQSKPEETGQ